MIVQIHKLSKGKKVSVHLVAEDEIEHRDLQLLVEAMKLQPALYLDHHVLDPKGISNVFLVTEKR